MKRRVFFGTFGLGTGLAAWSYGYEPDNFELSEREVKLSLAKPLRLLHVADFHTSDGMTAPELAAGLRLGLNRKPDLICLTGDFISHTSGYDEQGLINMLRGATDTAPTYAVLGNHDGGNWMARFGGHAHVHRITDILHKAGVRLLQNESNTEQGVQLIGVGDYWSGFFNPNAAFNNLDLRAPRILLSHNPDSKEDLLAFDWDLMLSGHTHGGQARIPGVTPYWTPVRDKRYISGLYALQNRQLYITRGIGSPKHIRINCRPEVSLLHLI